MKGDAAAPRRRDNDRPQEETAVKKPHAIAVVGNSGAGKTTLLERLIPALKEKGLRVGVVKHDAHRFDIDHPGKDSHRLTAAGADTMMITSASMLAMVKRHAASPPIEELLERYFTDMDLVLVEGFRVGAVKHDAHRFDIDHPGKDSHRLTAAGADTMMITSAEKLAMVKRHAASPPIEELLERYFSDMDLVLVEGFRGSSLPKIEVHRKEFRRALICRGDRNDPGLAAVASDEPLDLDVPVLDLNDAGAIAGFIASLVSGIERK